MMLVTLNSDKYRDRTKEVLRETELSIALGVNFETPGEVLTENYSAEIKTPCVQIDISPFRDGDIISHASVLKSEIDSIVWHIVEDFIPKNRHTINICGNSLHVFKNYDFLFSQKYLNDIVKYLLRILSEQLKTYHLKLKLVSSGQSGIDEAGIIAAASLKIPVTIISTKDYKFRNSEGKDVSSEELFLSRFDTKNLIRTTRNIN